MELLEVRNLRVSFHLDRGDLLAVRDVSFSVKEGETLGLVGESGCGKSVSAFSVLKLISPPGEITGGQILWHGRDLISLSGKELQKIRGKEISMIFQEPMTSLNPVMTVGTQVGEVFRIHDGMSKKEASVRAAEMLAMVGIPDPEKRVHSYPHQFSGGMRQRVMIAMALAAYPSLLIADEPTTALDVTIQAQIMKLLTDLRRERRMSLLLISHDLGLVSSAADNIAVMYAGEIVEYGDAEDIMNEPMHPYTQGLIKAVPTVSGPGKRLYTIPGTVPVLFKEPEGCAFFDRCGQADDSCRTQKVPLCTVNGRQVRCLKYR